MKVEHETLETCEAKLTVEVEPAQVEEAKRKAARKLAGRYTIPGFRKGKAPYDIIVRYLGDGPVLEAALDDLAQEIYQKALDEANLDPIGPGQMTDAKLDPPVFTYNVPLRPQVDLGSYRTMRLGYEEGTVTEEALNDYLEHQREHEAVLEPVDREAQLGDVLTVDVVGKVIIPPASPAAAEPVEAVEAAPQTPESESPAEPATAEAPLADGVTPVEAQPTVADGVTPVEAQPTVADGVTPVEATEEFLMDDQDVEVVLDPKLTWPAPGFAEKLVGIKPDEERHVELTFPDDYANESLRGKLAYFDVKVKGAKSRTLPEWDDELAKSLGHESVADMRAKAQDTLLNQSKRRVDDEYAKSVVDIVVSGSTVKYPPYLFDRELEEMTEDLDRRLREQNLTLEDYKKVTNRTDEQIREELEPGARERLRRSLVISKVVETEGLTVEDHEVNDRIEMVAPLFGKDAERYRKMMKADNARRSVAYDLLSDKAVKRLLEIAKGENPPLPGSLEVLSETNEPKAEPAVADGVVPVEANPETDSATPVEAEPAESAASGASGEADKSE